MDPTTMAGMAGGSSMATQALGMGLQYMGQMETNASNTANVNATNQMNAQEAALNRGFQQSQTNQAEGYNTMMSNTQYQRGVADLKAAGLNPLMAQTGPATSPTSPAQGGSSASFQAPQVTSPMTGLGESLQKLGPQFMQMLSTGADIRNKNMGTLPAQTQVNKMAGVDTQSSQSQIALNKALTANAAAGLNEAQVGARVWGQANQTLNKMQNAFQSNIDRTPPTNLGNGNWQSPNDQKQIYNTILGLP